MDSVFFFRNPDTQTAESGASRGLRVAFQPNVSVSEWPTDAGSKALSNFRALEDATIVRRLRLAGAFLCGSTRMSEFGFGLEGSTAGKAIQQKAADAELVLDLAGESRVAASNVDLCGFKPSYGVMSRLGLIGLIPSMECWGVLSGSVKNIREVLRIVAGPDERDFSLPDEKPLDFAPIRINPGEITIGVIPEALSGLPEAQRTSFLSSVAELQTKGFQTREISLAGFSLFSLVHRIVGSVEASSCAGRYDSVRYGLRAAGTRNWNEMYLASRGMSFGLLVKSYLFQGAFFQFERYGAYEDACRIRARLIADIDRLHSQADFLALPASGAPTSGAAPLDDTYAQFASTLFANVTGQPSLYLPSSSGSGQPGFQLAGPRLSDVRLLALGEYILNSARGGE